MRYTRAVAASMLALGGGVATTAIADQYKDLNSPADIMPQVACSLLNDVVKVNGSLIAVGERGHIVSLPISDMAAKDYAFDQDKICNRSSDEWRAWDQKATPTRAYLNATSFVGKKGWAVGHDAVILHTQDGGETWSVQFKKPELEKPFLDVLFTDTQNGFATGSYGMYYVTRNGGATWTEQVMLIDPDSEEPFDFHLNSITRLGDDTLFAAGESGALYRSADNGATWEKLESDYEGSYFGAVPYGKTGVIVFGLRGNVFVSRDRGDSWEKMDSGIQSTLLAGAALPTGEVIIGGLKGSLLMTQGGGRRLVALENPEEQAITGIVPVGADKVVLVSEKGVFELKL